MKFEIAFNKKDNNDTKEFYDFIGAKFIHHDEGSWAEIELNSFEELETLMNKINMKYYNNTWTYSAVVVFDNPVIYLDKDV
jgi:GTPase Era involved in 16S rRNA processing